MTTNEEKTVREFEVWAPQASSGVELLLGDERVPLTRDEGGWWRASAPAAPGAPYWFSLDGGDPRPDPRSRRLPEGPHGASAVFDPTVFAWTDDQWSGVELSDSVIYELHVGTFTAEGTLDAALSRLDHLVDLGVTLVELLPLASFPGVNGWGYDGVAPYAVHEPYGGPEALQRFVDACHGKGLGVCLDVVYNHLGPDGNYLGEFGPYFTDRYETPWGWALNLDGPQSDPVHAFVVDNALMWLRDFHVDALRLDAVHELYDSRALPVLEDLSQQVDALAAEVGRPLTLIAESDRNDPSTVSPRGPGGAGGTGLHAQWADDIHHGLHAALTGESQGYYGDFATPGALAKVLTTPFFHDGTWSSFRGRSHGRPVDPAHTPGWRFVASLQTHDQVGNRMTGERLSHLLSPGVLACGAALLLTSAYTPMLFMGEEWGASTPWQYFTDHTDPELARAVQEGRKNEFASHGWDRDEVPDPQAPETVEHSRLDWDEVHTGAHARLLDWYRSLIALRHLAPELHDGRLDAVEVQHDIESGVLVMTRGRYRTVVNLADAERSVPLGGTDATAYPVLLAWDPEGTTVRDGALVLPATSAAVLGPAATD
jgi:maltooligosyltrehalose trehalohydrolase